MNKTIIEMIFEEMCKADEWLSSLSEEQRKKIVEVIWKFPANIREHHAQLAYSLGKFYGYPECCITEFCNDIVNDRDPSLRNIDGSGFIPCRDHYTRIRLGDFELKSLINKNCLSLLKKESFD